MRVWLRCYGKADTDTEPRWNSGRGGWDIAVGLGTDVNAGLGRDVRRGIGECCHILYRRSFEGYGERAVFSVDGAVKE